jgi:CRP-like cAMP-binding protein
LGVISCRSTYLHPGALTRRPWGRSLPVRSSRRRSSAHAGLVRAHTRPKPGDKFVAAMDAYHDIMLRKLKAHSPLDSADEEILRTLHGRTRELAPGEDIIHEGEQPRMSSIVLEGMVGRYHTLPGGRRSYLSFHIVGDWPDLQSLLLNQMDHAVCAVGKATIVLIRHDQIRAICERRQSVSLALWRETLIDAAIFRRAISNHGGRGAGERIAHLLCELFFRSKAAGLVDGGTMALPLNQGQIGDALGLALVTVNRMLQRLRRTGAIEFREGKLTVRDWNHFAKLAEFDPEYLRMTARP